MGGSVDKNSSRKVVIFGEDSLLARAISDILEPHYQIVNSYSHWAPGIIRMKHYAHAWIPEVDAVNEDHVNQLVQNANIVVNCSGLVNTDKCKSDIYGAYRSNVKTAEVVTSFCKMYQVKLIHMATTASYSGYDVITENTLPATFQTVYSGSKLLGESLVRELYEENSWIVRPCFIFGGKRDTSSVLKKLVERHMLNSHPEWNITLSLVNKKDYLWVEDFAEGIKIMLEKGPPGTYNISKGIPITYNEILQTLAHAGIDVKNVTWNEDLDYLANHVVCCDKLRALGWNPKTSISEGIQRILKDYELDKNN